MPVTRLGRRALLAGAAVSCARTSHAAAPDPVTIGVLTDETGPYADSGGPGSIRAAEMAVADFGASVLGRPVRVIHADHQNKPDIAATIARRWYDRDGVDAIVDLPVTAIGLAVQQVAREHGRTVMITAAATADFTGKYCSPTSTHWADDTHALTAGTARAVIQGGGTSWFFITVDHAFGRALQEAATTVVEQAGGHVLGAARHPIGETDFAALLLQAQLSGAKVVGIRLGRRRPGQRHQAGARIRPDRQDRPDSGHVPDLYHRHPCAWSDGGAGPDLRRKFLLGPK